MDSPGLLQSTLRPVHLSDVEVHHGHPYEAARLPHAVAGSAGTTQGAPKVGQPLAVPAEHHREHVATAHETSGPDPRADSLGHRPVQLTESGAGAPVVRQGTPESGPDI